ncbi:hypothetical protein H0H87_000505 [Tephrocybe sp. NHM501043]|nr:hypothetical protein H0H87_000505 [Tephrocybe sp. NHM501043]
MGFPPTSCLPAIRQIALYPIKDLLESLAYLRHIYNPKVLGTRRRRSGTSSDLYKPLEVEDIHGIDELRNDAFERSYAMRWLTAVVALTEDSLYGTKDNASPEEWESLVQEAASLLAICSGTAAAGVVVRDFVFSISPTMENKLKIHVRDIPIDNTDFRSVGAQTWGGACVLTETILDNPVAFGLSEPRELRILELGAGTGLVSLALGKLFESAGTLIPPRKVVATDYYPSVLENLASNIHTNLPHSGVVKSSFLDWSTFPNDPTPSPPFDLPFDLVLGADIVYEPQHAAWIQSCLITLLRKPTENFDPLFHLMIPLRATHSSEINIVDSIFTTPKPQDTPSGLRLVTISKEIIVCDTETGREIDQIEYAYYRIGWR